MLSETGEKLAYITRIARVCHEVNRAYCQAIGDDSQPSWPEAPDWQRDSAIDGVGFVLDHPEAPVSAQHDHWLAHKQANGWLYGAVKDEVARTHPCMLPWKKLPQEQRVKDYLFRAVVNALK